MLDLGELWGPWVGSCLIRIYIYDVVVHWVGAQLSDARQLPDFPGLVMKVLDLRGLILGLDTCSVFFFCQAS